MFAIAYVGVRSIDKPEQKIPSLQVITHSSFQKSDTDYSGDIGLVELAAAVPQSSNS